MKRAFFFPLQTSQLLGITIGVIISVGAWVFYLQERELAWSRERQSHLQKIEEISKRLDEFIVISRLVSRLLESDVVRTDLKPQDLEQRLIEFLKKTPEQLIFGIGVFFEPYQFKKDLKFYGPYARREHNIEDQVQLTFQYQTPEYNYLGRDWYKQGLSFGPLGGFTEPYVEEEKTYVTYVQSFQAAGSKTNRGVIVVDLILPQLQNLLYAIMPMEQNLVSVWDSRGRLIAHSHRLKLIEKLPVEARTEYQQNGLMALTPDQIKYYLGFDPKKFESISIVQSELNWTITVASQPLETSRKLLSLVARISIALFFVWTLIVFYIWILFKKERERQQMSNEVEFARVQLIHSTKMAALGEMAAGVAHEINNPLTVINVMLANLKKRFASLNFEDPKSFELIERVESTSKRIARIVSGLRMFSRSGENDPFRKENLKTILDETLPLALDRLKSLEIKLDMNCPADIFIQCSATQISQVIINLVNNSIDAIENNSEKWIRIEVKELKPTQRVQIQITDSGAGIAPDVASKILQPFFTTKAVGKGTGLGLSISKGIIDRHGGEFNYNPSSRNTQFVITLPICDVA